MLLHPKSYFCKPRLIIIGSLLVLSALIAIARFHTYHEPLERDITEYAVNAHELLAGRSLYSDLASQKPPAICLTYAVAEKIFGYGPTAIYFLNVLASIIILLGIYAAGSVCWAGPAGGLWAAVFWAIISGNLNLQANQPNSELFLNACLIWIFALFLRMEKDRLYFWQTFTVGLLFAVSSLYKQIVFPAVFLLLFIHVLFFLKHPTARKSALKRVGIILGIVAVMWLGVFAYFASTGRLASFVSEVFTYNRHYAGSILKNIILSLYPSLLMPGFLKFTIPFAIFILIGIIFSKNKNSLRSWILFVVFALGTQIMVALPGRFFPHYYQLWLPLLAVGFGWAVVDLTRPIKPAHSRFLYLIGAILILFLLCEEIPNYRLSAEEWSRRKYGEVFVVSKNIGLKINKLLKSDETFYEWGNENGFYFYSQKHPPSGVLGVYGLVNSPISAQLSRQVVSDLVRKQPELFIVARDAISQDAIHNPVLLWFAGHYRPCPIFNDQSFFLFFVRRGSNLERRLMRYTVDGKPW